MIRATIGRGHSIDKAAIFISCAVLGLAAIGCNRGTTADSMKLATLEARASAQDASATAAAFATATQMALESKYLAALATERAQPTSTPLPTDTPIPPPVATSPPTLSVQEWAAEFTTIGLDGITSYERFKIAFKTFDRDAILAEASVLESIVGRLKALRPPPCGVPVTNAFIDGFEDRRAAAQLVRVALLDTSKLVENLPQATELLESADAKLFAAPPEGC